MKANHLLNSGIRSKWVLIVFPLLLIIIGLLLIGRQTLHYTVSSDPEYFYLLNGLNILKFQITSGNYIHPGIPLQYLSGIIIWVDFIFSGQYDDIIVDVMLRSEHYLNVLNGTIVVITGIVFFFSGLAIYRLTNSLAIAIFLQSVVFIDHIGFFQLSQMVPEKLILPTMLLLILLMIFYIQKDFLSKKVEKKLVIAVAFIIASSFMEKLTMLPLIFAPLFIFTSKQNLKIYSVSLLLFTFLFFIPIIEHLSRMYDFFWKMTTHTGYYGSGEEKIVDLKTVLPNLKLMFTDHFISVLSYLLLILFLILISFRKANSTFKLFRIKQVIKAFAFVETLMLIMLMKHFKSHYFTPVAALSLFNIYLILEFIRESKLITQKKIFNYFYFTISLILLLLSYPSIKFLFKIYDTHKTYENQLIQINTQVKNMPKIILPKYYGTPFEEFAIYQAIYYSNNKRMLGEVAKTIWPSSYFYTSEWGLYDMAYGRYKLPEVLQKHKNFILSYYDGDEFTKNNFFKELKEAGLDETYTFKTIYYNDDSKVTVIQMTKLDTLNSYEKIYSVSWDMEETNIKKDKPLIIFDENELTDKIAYSGRNSLLLTKESESGLAISFDSLCEGDIILGTAWRFRNGNKSGMAVLSDRLNHNYESSNEVIEAGNYWDKIEIREDVFAKVNNETIKIYLWRNDKSSPVYFDEIYVSVFRPKFPNDTLN